ncbi:hypothetical protein, partial [Sphingobium sp. LB126]|uniref:hypothetical protein n=1 Tax=Sphingobium sp. LB126 TaxID=1983755 RepID=UPI001A8FCAAB
MHLPIVRLNNALPIRTAYGERAAQAALDHLRQKMDRHFGTEGCRVDGTGVALCPLADPFVHAPMLDSLCILLEADPFRFEG